MDYGIQQIGVLSAEKIVTRVGGPPPQLFGELSAIIPTFAPRGVDYVIHPTWAGRGGGRRRGQSVRRREQES